MKKYFTQSAKTALILIYLVIVAGALVRMTGSGMGCPDWPKCFGYYIPPTDVEELTWRANKTFEKGQVIVKDEQLFVANHDFTTSSQFEDHNWELYTKHDYAIFNPLHTWIEYINRLTGAVAGIATLVMAVLSIGFWKSRKEIVLLSWLAVFLMGFQAWLGATVVYSVLNPLKITVHMVMALVIVALVIYIIKISKTNLKPIQYDRKLQIALITALILSLIQVILGTQVREFVDEHVQSLGYEKMHEIMNNPTLNFYAHRSFSIIIVLQLIYIYFRSKKMNFNLKKINWLIVLISIEIFSGLAMYYFAFPFGTQSIHLVSAALLFGIQFALVLETRKSSEK